MKMYISILEAGLIFGVTTTTLRRWEELNKLKSHHRTIGNHRRYELNEIFKLVNPNKEIKPKKTVCYARVSSHDQKLDLERQRKVLEIYVKENDLDNIVYINDIGSGLNYKKKVLNNLIKLILNNEVDINYYQMIDIINVQYLILQEWR